MDVSIRVIAKIIDLLYMVINRLDHSTRPTPAERELFAASKFFPREKTKWFLDKFVMNLQ